MTSIHRALAGSPSPNEIFQWASKSRVTPDSYRSNPCLRDNHDRVFSSRVSLDSYHSTLSLRDNHERVFSSLGQQNFSAYTSSLLHPHRNSGSLPGSLTPTQKFQNGFLGLLHPHRNFGFLHRSLTPIQIFRITPRVSYTLTEILDNTTGLLHPHRNSGHLPGSLTPTQKFQDISPGLLHPYRYFRTSPRVSYTHTGPFGYYRGSPSP